MENNTVWTQTKYECRLDRWEYLALSESSWERRNAELFHRRKKNIYIKKSDKVKASKGEQHAVSTFNVMYHFD